MTLRLFIQMNEWTWNKYPAVDEAEQAVLAVASGDWDIEQTTAWLRPLLAEPPVSR